MGMRKLTVAVLLATIALGAVSANARSLCGGPDDGYLHLRISPAQGLYGLSETVKVNAEVVRRLPTGDVPAEGADVLVSLSSRGVVAYGRATTDVDGQAILRVKTDRLGMGLVDAGGWAEVNYTNVNHCIDPTHRDTVWREDFIRIVK